MKYFQVDYDVPSITERDFDTPPLFPASYFSTRDDAENALIQYWGEQHKRATEHTERCGSMFLAAMKLAEKDTRK